MEDSHRPTLARIVDDLGSTLLTIVDGPPVLDRPVGSLAIYDPADEWLVGRGDLLLGVGVTDPATVRDLLVRLGAAGAAALLVKTPVPMDDAVRHAVADTGVTLIEVTRAATWAQLTAVLRALLDTPELGEPGEELAGFPSGDLFQLANAIGALLDAPVTIEDRSSRVLAFSGGQDNTDEARVQTVLGRQVPERYLRILTDRDVFRDLYRSNDPMYIEPPKGYLPRVAATVRAGTEVLGSIWAVVRGPLPHDRQQAFADAAKIVALHLLRQRAGDVNRRLRAELVATLLENGTGAADAARRLGLHNKPVCVLGMELAQDAASDDQATRAAELERVAGALTLHLNMTHSPASVTTLGGVAYGIVLAPSEQCGVDKVVRVVAEFLRRTGKRHALRAGVGRAAIAPSTVRTSRDDVDSVLRVLREAGRPEPVATIADVRMDLMLLRLADLCANDDSPIAAPLARLLAYDQEHRSDLVETLTAYLDAFGDVGAAANAVHVHQNTFRYRLRRLTEIGGLDLSDPDARLGIMLDMRIRKLRGT